MYIESHAEIKDHPKTKKLARLLRIKKREAIGLLHMLWWWGLAYAYSDGDISRFEDSDIDDAVEWDGEPEAVAQALRAAGWIEPDGRLHDWQEYGGKLQQKLFSDRERKRLQRKTAEVPAPSEGCPEDVHRNSIGCPADVSGRGEERRGEERREEERRGDHESHVPDGTAQAPSGPSPCPHQEIVQAYHEALPSLPAVQVWNDKRQGFLRTRWQEAPERQSVEWWKTFFLRVAASDFLCGRTSGTDGRPFLADLEWLVRPTNFVKVIEGRYDNRKGPARPTPGGGNGQGGFQGLDTFLRKRGVEGGAEAIGLR